MKDARHERDRDTTPYRIVVAGRVGAGWVDWFGADTVEPREDRTVLRVRVADQAELFGRLRRVQDLKLRLLEVTLIPSGAQEASSPEGSSVQRPERKGDLP